MKRTLLLLTALLFSTIGISQSLQQAATAMHNGGAAKPKTVQPVAKSPQQKTSGQTTQREDFVDLGLSVKWATCNIGASSPEQYGNYYAWGETSTKYEYGSYCAMCGKTLSTLRSNGIINWGNNLTTYYDVAQRLGKGRMPTSAEIKELYQKCRWWWTTLNGVNGYRITGLNGNSIFLPAAGSRFGSGSRDVGSYGFYWSSMAYDDSYNAYFLYFGSDGFAESRFMRSNGFSVRPVMDK